MARRTTLAAILLLALPAPGWAGDPPAASSKVERTEVRAVLIDAVVTGEGGVPVRGLGAGAFRLKIDGRDAAIASFEDHCPAGQPAPAIAASAAPPPVVAIPDAKEPPAVVSAEISSPRRVVLFFDLPHLSPMSAARSVRAARRSLEASVLEGDRYMVVAFGPDVRVLAAFTGDRDRVLAALDGVMKGEILYDEGPLARSARIQEVAHETCLPAMMRGGKCPNQTTLAARMAKEEESIARRSLDALQATMVALSGVPGRKAFVFFTETLRDEPGTYYLALAKTFPGAEQISIAREFREVVEEANASSVSFYPVYAPGLEDPSDTDLSLSVTSVGTKAEKAMNPAVAAVSPAGAMPFGKSQREADVGPIAEAQRSAEAAAVGFNASIAAETGGRSLGRTNDLAKVFPVARDDLSCFYVLSYAPPGPADGKRHRIVVSVERKGSQVRSRETFTDWGPDERRDRLLATAVAAPGAFRDLRVTLDAFALGKSKKGRQVLVKASVPAADLMRSSTGVPPDDGGATVRIRGRVSNAKAEACAFVAGFPVAAVREAAGRGGLLQYEAECTLPPGPYEIALAVLEERGGQLGASRREIGVPGLAGLQVPDPQLWVGAPFDLVYREQASGIFGSTKGVARGAATPRAERRLMPGETGSLLLLVCPKEGAAAAPVTVTRAILSGEAPAATFPPQKLTGLPDPASGCWGVTSAIPSGTLGSGIYTFEYAVSAPGLTEPIEGRAAFAVGAEAVPTPSGPAVGGEPPPR